MSHCRGAAAGSPPPRAALLGAIQSGARLRKATTNDRSIVQGAGHILSSAGATETEAQDATEPKPALGQSSDTANSRLDGANADSTPSTASTKGNRQSVDWYGGLAADHYPSPSTQSPSQTILPQVQEDVAEEDRGSERDGAHDPQRDLDRVDSETASDDMEDPNIYFDMANCTFSC